MLECMHLVGNSSFVFLQGHVCAIVFPSVRHAARSHYGYSEPKYVIYWPSTYKDISTQVRSKVVGTCQGLMHASSTLLDIGQFSTSFSSWVWGKSCSSWLVTAKICTGTRVPPRLPATFKKELATKHFTTGNVDRDIVNALYESTFNDTRPDSKPSPGVSRCPWGPAMGAGRWHHFRFGGIVGSIVDRHECNKVSASIMLQDVAGHPSQRGLFSW